MNCEPGYSILTQFTLAKKIFFLLISFNITIYGQTNKTGYNDIKKQRLLVHITSDYLHTISQGQIDMDSAVRTSCKIYNLSILIPYNEIYSNGKPTIETKLLEQGKVKKVESLLVALKGESRLLLLLELSSYYIFKPGTQKADLDQAETYIDEILEDKKLTKWKIGALTLKADLLHQSGLTDESQKLLSEIERLCKKSKNSLDQARALLNAGKTLQYGHPLRLVKFEKALSIFHALQEKEKEIETLSQINIEYFIAKRYKESEKLILKILKLQKEIKYHHNQYAFDVLSYLSYRDGDLVHALSYSNKSITSMRSKSDSTFKSMFFSRRAGIYQYLKKNEDALVWYKKALENRTNDTKLYWYKTFLVNVELLNSMRRDREALSLLQETENKFPARTDFEKMHYALLLGETYENLKKTELAEKNYKVFLNMIQNFPIDHVHDEFPAAFFRISAFYRNLGKTVLARELLNKGINHSFEIGHAKKSEYYYNLFKIDSVEHKYSDAIKNLQLSQKYKDSAFGNEQQKKAAELLIKYEADKKDKNIKILNTQNQLQHIKSQEAERAKNIILIGSLLLLAIIGLLLNRYIIKQKSNRKLEANQRELDQKNMFLETLNIEQEKLLKEKEWLIKEVHHRVKNNLQMVTSLLNSQSIYLEDDDAKMAVKDSLRRMQAMSMIHQKLYQDDNISTIAMPEYITELVHYLHESFDSENKIIFEKNIAPISLDLSQAIPLGLIITESIVNAIKYAFIGEQKGIINISLQPEGNDSLLLKISDNGVGITIFHEKSDHHSLGHDLMQGLTKQLKGSFTIENNNGVHIMVKFIHLNK
ncbi:sensor histidine kinase [Flavobacterium aquidurense]|uniref:tetratricopeptide repeat-containing sensor histidine kinase n=1 Tax=Flavobacterium aquidurense TaxID=362413 RepID=UPI00285C14D6|nr:sensor histidine kinase [Flavobacterium aquidurense]MDR7370274.1 two-component sensor histidine kinase/tetratricopeptide (TPR) repeat protein [Flavobacterium aquidurense]